MNPEPSASADDVVWADAVLYGSPTRYGNIAGQLKLFLDGLGPQWAQGLLADKVYAGFTASQTAQWRAGDDVACAVQHIHHCGGILVAPGYTDPSKYVDGNPYGVSHATGAGNGAPLTAVQYTALDHLATRVVTVARQLKGDAVD